MGRTTHRPRFTLRADQLGTLRSPTPIPLPIAHSTDKLNRGLLGIRHRTCVANRAEHHWGATGFQTACLLRFVLFSKEICDLTRQRLSRMVSLTVEVT